MMWTECCKRCKKATISTDHVARKKSCSACGLECDYDDVPKNDTVSVGDLTNPLLSKTGLSKNGSSDDLLSLTFGNSKNRGFDSVSIADMSDRLGLPATVKDEVNEVFKKMDAFNYKGMLRNALFAGCIYVVCRISDMTRSMEEICSVANGATISEILQAIEFVAEKLNMNTKLLMDIKPADFIKRFCSYLGMDSREVEAVQVAAGSYECGDRSPVSVAAVFVYAFARHYYEKKLLKEIGEAAGLSAQTIGETYKDLIPYMSTELPKMAARIRELKNT